MANLKDYFTNAKNQGFALGAFNLDSFETLKAVCLAAEKLGSSVLVEVSPGEEKYLGIRNVASLVDNARHEFGIPIFLNLDHAEDLDVIEKALDFGFDLVHYDGSKLSPEENIANTEKVVSWAHAKDILVEGEVDHIPITNNPITNNQYPTTNPPRAKIFVEQTGVDIFAVSIGNKHGVGESEKLDLPLLQKIQEAVPDTFFSLHGGSGIPAEDIRAAIKLGVVKININTELRLAFKKGLEESLKNNPSEAVWSKIAQPALEAVQKVVENKMIQSYH